MCQARLQIGYGPRSRAVTGHSVQLAPCNATSPPGIVPHEIFHQWFGDNVREANFDMALSREGMADLGEALYAADRAARNEGGPSTATGRTAIERQLAHAFDFDYTRLGPGAWQLAQSKRPPAGYLDVFAVYVWPADALVALRQIFGPRDVDAVLHAIQHGYGGLSITEPEVKRAFAAGLPNHSASCRTRLTQFFTQWFDTAYHGSKPQITGPGLDGHPFYTHGCTAPHRR
jgi:hypothetical protein